MASAPYKHSQSPLPNNRAILIALIALMVFAGTVALVFMFSSSLQPSRRANANAELVIPLSAFPPDGDYIEKTEFGELHVNLVDGANAVPVASYPNGYYLPLLGASMFYCSKFSLVEEEYRCTDTHYPPNNLKWMRWIAQGKSIDPEWTRNLPRPQAKRIGNQVSVKLMRPNVP